MRPNLGAIASARRWPKISCLVWSPQNFRYFAQKYFSRPGLYGERGKGKWVAMCRSSFGWVFENIFEAFPCEIFLQHAVPPVYANCGAGWFACHRVVTLKFPEQWSLTAHDWHGPHSALTILGSHYLFIFSFSQPSSNWLQYTRI